MKVHYMKRFEARLGNDEELCIPVHDGEAIHWAVLFAVGLDLGLARGRFTAAHFDDGCLYVALDLAEAESLCRVLTQKRNRALLKACLADQGVTLDYLDTVFGNLRKTGHVSGVLGEKTPQAGPQLSSEESPK